MNFGKDVVPYTADELGQDTIIAKLIQAKPILAIKQDESASPFLDHLCYQKLPPNTDNLNWKNLPKVVVAKEFLK